MSAENQPLDAPASPAPLLDYYEAIERASARMLEAARHGDWQQVVQLEGACAVLIGQLKRAAQQQQQLSALERQAKARIMQRVLGHDAQIRHLAEPWLEDIAHLLGGKPRTLH